MHIMYHKDDKYVCQACGHGYFLRGNAWGLVCYSYNEDLEAPHNAPKTPSAWGGTKPPAVKRLKNTSKLDQYFDHISIVL